MNELVGLLQQIESLPASTFKIGVPLSERSKEFSLLDSVLPTMFTAEELGVVRKCRRDEQTLSMHYQLRNGKFHDICIAYDKDTGTTSMSMDGARMQVPESKEELTLFFQLLLDKSH